MHHWSFLLPSAVLVGYAGVALGDSPGPGQNPWQAYPPSCLAYPLPGPAGPTWSARASLETSLTMEQDETVNFIFWRTPCSGGKSALLGKIFRDAASANKFPEPIFSGLEVSQGSVHDHDVRVATEPNTVLSNFAPGQTVSNSLEFVFENDATASIDYSQAINLTILGVETVVPVAIPAYDASQYPNAALPLQLSGYLTGNFYDTAHGGEGAQVEVGTGSNNSRYIVFAWYTFDPKGVAFWLFGLGGFNAGDRSADVTVAYATGGGFAGNFGASATTANWGSVTVQFPDCNTMHFTYQANSGLPSALPQGSGSRTWTRLTGINGLGCQ